METPDQIWNKLSEEEKWRKLGGKLWDNQLPEDILFKIGLLLNDVDIDQMRLVCKSFRQIFSPRTYKYLFESLNHDIYKFVNKIVLLTNNHHLSVMSQRPKGTITLANFVFPGKIQNHLVEIHLPKCAKILFCC